MGRQLELGNPRTVARRFVCDGCGKAVLLHGWESRPDGWWTLIPPRDGGPDAPLEYLVCNEYHGANLLMNKGRERTERLRAANSQETLHDTNLRGAQD